MSNFLYVFRHAPYANPAGQEGLDALLSACSLDLNVTMLLLDDAVFLLKSGQNVEGSQLRQYTKGFKAVNDFGLERIVVDSQSLDARGLSEGDLIMPVELASTEQVRDLMKHHSHVLVF